MLSLDELVKFLLRTGGVPHGCSQHNVLESSFSAKLLEHIDVPDRRALDTVVSNLVEVDCSRQQSTVELLSALGAEIDFKTLRAVMAGPSPERFIAMVGLLENRYMLIQLLREAGTTLDNSDRAFSVYQCLLEKDVLLGNPISSEDKSEALLGSLDAVCRSNTSSTKLLLQYGAMVEYRHGDAFRRALWANAVDVVTVLSQYIVDDSVARDAFAHALRAPLKNQNIRLKVCRCLLEHNIEATSLQGALVKALNESSPSQSILQLLLEAGANPNNDDAVCFISTAKAGREAEFRLLSKYAKLKVALPKLLSGLKEEYQVVKWFGICLEEFPRASITGQDQLLFECLRKFPLGTKLLTLLLTSDVSASAALSKQSPQRLET